MKLFSLNLLPLAGGVVGSWRHGGRCGASDVAANEHNNGQRAMLNQALKHFSRDSGFGDIFDCEF